MGGSERGENERYRGGGEQEQWWVGTVGGGRDNYQPTYAYDSIFEERVGGTLMQPFSS